ncbi:MULTISPECIES: hypothetical protein [unclassified Pantoea]|jgi:hypothetical protein|uniref:hypothetical protein n=1 Tax=unclassified Pantoea TaxID=2630326 RepID=UPI0013549DCB|nr:MULTISPECIES: hypothetical protein [unclassified Pantoea]MXP56841.1 hypothetical protein [Pantoea sp. Taur]
MPEFIFYRKEQIVATLERSDVESAVLLISQGYKKLDEEVEAATPEAALKRLADVQNQDNITHHAFVTGSVFTSIVNALFK